MQNHIITLPPKYVHLAVAKSITMLYVMLYLLQEQKQEQNQKVLLSANDECLHTIYHVNINNHNAYHT